MRSTETIHEIVELVPVDDRKKAMAALKNLRLQVKKEVIATINNADRMIELLYKK